MGFWGTLARIGGAIAAPFTGGASLAITEGLNLAGDVVGGMAKQGAANRGQAEQAQLSRDSLALRAMQDFEQAQQGRARLQMDQESHGRGMQSDAYRKALLGALGQNVQDATVSREGFSSPVPHIQVQGGLRPSALGATGRDLAGVLERQAGDALRSPTAPMAMAPLEKFSPAEAPKMSLWEKILGPASLALGAAGKFGRRPDEEETGVAPGRLGNVVGGAGITYR